MADENGMIPVHVAGGRAPAVPDPASTSVVDVGLVVERSAAVRAYCAMQHDIGTAETLRRALIAYSSFVLDRKTRAQLEAEQRRTEILIGMLLGTPLTREEAGALGGRGNERSSAADDLSDEQKVEFRRLAAQHAAAEELVDAGVVKRSQLLAALDRRGRQQHAAPTAAGRYEKLERDFTEPGGWPPFDVIVTDPPYDRAAIGQLDRLSEFAVAGLPAGASMFVMVGHVWLPLALERLIAGGMTYHWTVAYMTPGQTPTAPLHARRVSSQWKPVLWFTNGELDRSGPVVGDVVTSRANDKRFHEWGQSVSGMVELVQLATSKVDGDVWTVCDPYCGAGTTGVAALLLGHRFVGCDRDRRAVEETARRLEELDGA
jgi:hypothetical protein